MPRRARAGPVSSRVRSHDADQAEATAAADDSSGEEGETTHTGINPTMMNARFGNSASHPLGWSGTGPKRASAQATRAERGATGWSQAEDLGVYQEFLAAAAQVPEALPRPVALDLDVRVVLNLPPQSPVAAELQVVSVREETTAKPVRSFHKVNSQESKAEATSPLEEYDGACGVVVEEEKDGRFFRVETTRKGVTHLLRVPGHGLLWQGALVTLEIDEKEELGLLACERPDRQSGRWCVEIQKTLALLPGNLRERRLPGFEDERALGATSLPLVRGVAVELCNLRAGAAYNGLSGVVLSTAPNERGRWEVMVKVPMHLSRERFHLIGVPPQLLQPRREAGATAAAASCPDALKVGDEVEIKGLRAAEHNGKRGRVLQRVTSKSGEGYRWRVQCDAELILDLKEVNVFKVVDDTPSTGNAPMLPGDGSDGRQPPMFRSSWERATAPALGRRSSQLGPRKAAQDGGAKKRPREEALDPMELLEEKALAEECAPPGLREEEQLDAAKTGCERLQLVMRAGAGVDNIAVPILTQRGIRVANAQGANAVAVAELTMAHLLNLDRRLSDQVESLRWGEWRRLDFAKGCRGLYGQTLAVLGAGNIGREVIRRALAFGMRVRAWSRSPPKDPLKDVEYCTTPEEAADGADAMTIHLPLSKTTRHLVGRSLLQKLKPGALLVNMSRGGVVNEAELLEAIEVHGLRAGLDVYAHEPGANDRTFQDEAIMASSGVYGTHHTGARTEQAAQAVEDAILEVISAYLEGRPIPGQLAPI
ncbi:D-3-phosphoglycerate dehydrogenase (PGDH) [Durusdinium trenchii]|uniref:D-3-phosphoglycerate dehydrogenase (PGDH) n=1 Tax=Durusdinium trenchii TaxID=1381693 RepID=A0ABP0JSV9_9DINO